MSLRRALQYFMAGLLTLGAISLSPNPSSAFAQEELPRKVKVKVAPEYPELARRMSISGVVKLQVVVAPNGTVKSTKVLGGHPVLANAATDAVKKWKFEPAAEETSGIIEVKFNN